MEITTGPVRDAGVVLRTLRLGETSQIVSVLSAGHGRVKLVAKGSRNLRSRLRALLEPGNELELVFYAHPRRELWLLKEASLRRAALTGVGSLPKLSHLFAALELADRLLPEREAVAETAALFEHFLDRWHGSGPDEMTGLFFLLELGMLEQAGIGLGWRHCGSCGVALAQSPRVVHRAREGVLECADCGRRDPSAGFWLEASALGALAALGGAGWAASAKELTLAPEHRRALGRLLHEHFTYHLPAYRLPRSLYWLRAETPLRRPEEA